LRLEDIRVERYRFGACRQIGIAEQLLQERDYHRLKKLISDLALDKRVPSFAAGQSCKKRRS